MVAYCRVSTEREEQLESLKNQREFFEKFARQSNHSLLKIYTDEGISGKQMKNRVSFMKMLNDARLGLFDIVAVKDVSRFARNTVDFLISVRELKELGIEVLFIASNQTVLGNSEFVLTMFSALAQEESANLSERVKFGKKINAKHGKVPNFVYGYDRIDKFTLKINKKQSEVVKKIFDMYVKEKAGSGKIAEFLSENNIPTYKNLKVWTPKTVRRILKNPIYCGTLISKKTEGTNFLTGKRVKIGDVSEYTFKKLELAVISEDVFLKAQKITESRRVLKGKEEGVKKIYSKYVFSAHITCNYCGKYFSRRIYKNKRGIRAVWICGGKNIHGSSFCKNGTVIDEEFLTEEIAKQIFKKIADKGKFILKTNRLINPSSFENTKKADDLSEKKERYINLYAKGMIDESELEKYLLPLNSELKRQANQKGGKGKRTKISEENLYFYIKKVLSGKYANAFLKSLTDGIFSDCDGILRINWK